MLEKLCIAVIVCFLLVRLFVFFFFLLGIKKMINLNWAYSKFCLVAGKCGKKSGNNLLGYFRRMCYVIS